MDHKRFRIRLSRLRVKILDSRLARANALRRWHINLMVDPVIERINMCCHYAPVFLYATLFTKRPGRELNPATGCPARSDRDLSSSVRVVITRLSAPDATRLSRLQTNFNGFRLHRVSPPTCRSFAVSPAATALSLLSRQSISLTLAVSCIAVYGSANLWCVTSWLILSLIVPARRHTIPKHSTPDTPCTWLTDLSAHSFRAGGSYSSIALAVPSWWMLKVNADEMPAAHLAA